MKKSLEEVNLEKLKKMRFIATSLLIIMAIIFFVSKHFDNEHHNTILAGIAAFSEASMVGGLADWFAVVALFKHPLHMKWIPHTAIIQRRKDEIGEGLAEFVVNNFLKDRLIKERLAQFDLVNDLVSFVDGNKTIIAKSITENVSGLMKDQNKSGFNDILKNEITKVLNNIDVAPILAKGLSMLKASDKHLPLLRQLIDYIVVKVEPNKEFILDKLKDNHGFVKRMLIDRFGPNELDKVIEVAKSIARNESNQINRDFDKFVDENIDFFIWKLNNSPEMKEKVKNMKDDIFESGFLNDTIPELIDNMKNAMVLYSEENAEELQQRIVEFIDGVLLEKISTSEEIKEKLNTWLTFNIRQIISIYKKEVGSLIKGTIVAWDGDEVAKKIEVQVGKDLQYIRINGTVIGGIVGLLLYILTSVIHI